MSGYASYDDAHDKKYADPVHVPIVKATEETLRGYGRVVKDYEQEEVEIVTWPQQGWRPIAPRTGNQGGVVSGAFEYWWQGDTCRARNNAVGGDYVIGRLPQGANKQKREHVLVREANYHPDGGQVFQPRNFSGNPAFVMLLAKPGDDVTPREFRAFHCDGTFGVQIHPGIWHQPVYPLADRATFDGKQGAVHACVCVDFPKEFGKYLLVPLVLN